MIRLTQQASLQQKMAPQLIHSLRLLQMPTIELEQAIQQELEINPLLEEVLEPELTQEEEEEKPQEEPADDEGSLDTETPVEASETPEVAEEPVEAPEVVEEAEVPTLPADEPVDASVAAKDVDGSLDADDWKEYLNEATSAPEYTSHRQEFDPNEEPWEVTEADRPSMADLLREQLLLTDLSEAEREVAEYIIGNLDDDGFLTISAQEIADVLGISVSEVERVLKAVQSFEPSGIAARDLRECLMIQLRDRGMEDSLATALVRDHLDDLMNRRYSRICRLLNVTKEQVSEASKVIESLNPKPGFSPEPRLNVNLVYPDLLVEKVDDTYVVLLNDRNVPTLRVSPLYKVLLNQSEKEGGEAKKFVLSKLNSARWLINAIDQRRGTMLKVMRCIVENQQEFFDEGPGHLRPMVLQEVADKVRMHVSTISRVINGKYVQTTHGVYELKYFFDGKLSTEEGDIATKSVKEKIAKMVSEEDPKDPLSDQKIAEILRGEGIDIARRTVAKYRDQLKISPARYRKRPF